MDAVDRDGDGIGDNLTRLTFTPPPTYEATPAWSPDGTQIAFTRDFAVIYKMNADGTNQIKLANNPSSSSPFLDWGMAAPPTTPIPPSRP
jgi:Tol biopolymer transport system component